MISHRERSFTFQGHYCISKQNSGLAKHGWTLFVGVIAT